ncbi:unnamed protein product [Rhizophagus irregularis]|nr:unnamed protein product [Rhizophagus irregularis]
MSSLNNNQGQGQPLGRLNQALQVNQADIQALTAAVQALTGQIRRCPTNSTNVGNTNAAVVPVVTAPPTSTSTTNDTQSLVQELLKQLNSASNTTIAYPAQRRSQTRRAEPYSRPVDSEGKSEEEEPPKPINIPAVPYEVPRSAEPTVAAEVAEPSSRVAERTNVNNVSITIKKKKAPMIKKKKKTNLQPLISLHVPPYSMVDDIKNQQARITFGQLLEVAPKCRSELIRGIRKPTIRKMNLGEQEIGDTATVLYCDAMEKRKLQGLIDSSSQPKEDDDGLEKEDTDEEETDDDSIKKEEEEFEDDELEEQDACYFCQDDLVTYQVAQRFLPTILKEISRGQCDDGVVPSEEQRRSALTNQPYDQLILEKVAAENDRQLCHYCGQKTHLEFEQLTKEVEYYHTEIGSEVETTPTTVKMKVGTLPIDLELPLLRFLVQRRGNFAWNSSDQWLLAGGDET